MTETLTVTISVDTDDILDVLAWHESTEYGWEGHEYKRANDRWLAAYQDGDGERKEDLFAAMPSSLGWCVHEVEKRGVTPLYWALAQAGVSDPRIEDDRTTDVGVAEVIA